MSFFKRTNPSRNIKTSDIFLNSKSHVVTLSNQALLRLMTAGHVMLLQKVSQINSARLATMALALDAVTRGSSSGSGS